MKMTLFVIACVALGVVKLALLLPVLLVCIALEAGSPGMGVETMTWYRDVGTYALERMAFY